MKKKWDELEKKRNHVSIQGIVARNIWNLTDNRREAIYFLANFHINKKGLHNRFTKACLRTLKKIGKHTKGK